MSTKDNLDIESWSDMKSGSDTDLRSGIEGSETKSRSHPINWPNIENKININ